MIISYQELYAMSKLYCRVYVHVFCLHYTLYTCNQLHSKVMRHRYICQKSPTYPRYDLTDKSIKNNLQQNELTIHQYPTCTKAGHGFIRLSLKQQLKILIFYKLENTICTTIGNKLTLLGIANGKAVK